MDKGEAKRLVIKAGKELVHSGLIARTWGNVSVRIDQETFAITPSGKDYMTLGEEDIVEVKMKDLSYEGVVKPSSEKRLHRDIYKNRLDASLIIHTHQQSGSAVSAMPLDVFRPEAQYPGLGKEIRCAKYALPGTKKFSRNVVSALKKSESNAVLLKYHGVVCFGESYEGVFQTARSLEDACSDYLDGVSLTLSTAKGEDWKEGESLGEIWNRDPIVMEFLSLEMDLLPFSEDFAQMIGARAAYVRSIKDAPEEGAALIKKKGALCRGKTRSEAEAIAMLMTKNCKAFFAASAVGRAKPIGKIDVIIMRTVYLKKYAKLKGEGDEASGNRIRHGDHRG